jgi:hypothetical protein
MIESHTTEKQTRKQRIVPAGALRRALRTVEAADYCGVSASLFRKFRKKGAVDPGEHGPEFIRLSAMIIVYEIAALDAWLDSRKTRKAA